MIRFHFFKKKIASPGNESRSSAATPCTEKSFPKPDQEEEYAEVSLKFIHAFDDSDTENFVLIFVIAIIRDGWNQHYQLNWPYKRLFDILILQKEYLKSLKLDNAMEADSSLLDPSHSLVFSESSNLRSGYKYVRLLYSALLTRIRNFIFITKRLTEYRTLPAYMAT